MLYDTNKLTIEQVNQIIDEKMLSQINLINEWLKENDYILLLYSTSKEKMKDMIFSNDELYYPFSITEDSDKEILSNSLVSKKDMLMLEEWVKKHEQSRAMEKAYETNIPDNFDIVSTATNLTAKKLLEYNRNDGDAMLVFCVPRKRGKLADREKLDNLSGIITKPNPYLRRKISIKYNENDDLEFNSIFFYPKESIILTFDRSNDQITFNNSYDETYFFDDTTPQKSYITKGDFSTKLKTLNETFDSKLNRRAK